MLNLKRSYLIFASALALGTTAIPTMAHAEPTVYQGPNGRVIVNGVNRNVYKGRNGTIIYNGVNRNVVKGSNGRTLYNGVRYDVYKRPNGTVLRTPNRTYINPSSYRR